MTITAREWTTSIDDTSLHGWGVRLVALGERPTQPR